MKLPSKVFNYEFIISHEDNIIVLARLGITVVGATVVGTTVVGATVVGATVVGATVVGTTVVGITVVGATEFLQSSQHMFSHLCISLVDQAWHNQY